MEAEKTPAKATGVNLTLDQFQTLMQTLIAESRKPVIDPLQVSQKQRMKESNRIGIENKRKHQLAKFRMCNHMQRGPYAGCCAVAWAMQSDGIVRGPCQNCGTFFSPKLEECIDPEVHEMYKHLIRIQTHPAGAVHIA